jgi:predicted Zn-dependent protease
VQFDRQISVTVYKGKRSGSASTRQFDDASLKQVVADAEAAAAKARESQDAPVLTGPQEYIPVDAVLPSAVNFGPAERA